jgi:hypothetical protein
MGERLMRELDTGTGRAIALMTLFATARPEDESRARALLDGYLSEEDGLQRTIAGFQSLCGALLALVEFETGTSAEALLQRVGVIAAAAQQAARD